MKDNQPLNLTPDAIAHLKKTLAKNPAAMGIKIGVKDSGCSGKAYCVDFAAKEPAATDFIQEIDGIKLIIDQESLAYLNGTELDCKQEGLNALLKFNNPNVAATCGCGESFQVKK